MEIQYFPTLKCNLNCDYCVSHNTVEYTIQQNRTTLLNIFKLFKEKNSGTLYIVGGEPSFHKNFIPMMKYIRLLKKTIFNAKVELQTNLSLPLSRYKEVDDAIDFYSVSLHFIELYRKNRLKNFTENLEFVKNKIYNLDIMLEHGTPEEIELEKEYILDLYKKDLKYKSSEMIYSYYGGYDNVITKEFEVFYQKYSKTKNCYFNKDTNTLFLEKPSFKGYYCEARANYLSILGDGTVFSCAGHYFEKNNPLGNINLNYKKFNYSEPCVCEYNDCCGAYYFHRSLKPFDPKEVLDE